MPHKVGLKRGGSKRWRDALVKHQTVVLGEVLQFQIVALTLFNEMLHPLFLQLQDRDIDPDQGRS